MRALWLLLLGMVTLCSAQSLDLDTMWENFKQTYNKSYSCPMEEKERRGYWEKELEEVQRHNLQYDLGQHTYTVGINEFSDWSPEEQNVLNGFIPPAEDPSTLYYSPEDAMTEDAMTEDADTEGLPWYVDWRTKGYVTPVKNQGQCGSCWAFSVTGVLEGQTKRKTGRLVSLSEQNLVDCSRGFGTHGCNGGWMGYAYNYIQKNRGIDTEKCYPYYAKDMTCRYKSSCIGAKCSGYVRLSVGNEAALQVAVATIGPISVAIDVTRNFYGYKSGVFVDPTCKNTQANHAVLVVGYGYERGQAYWLVKNSWGTGWGDGGYIKMARYRNDMCAIARYATYPTV